MPAVFKVRRPVRSTTTRPKAEPPTFANGEALRLPAHFSAAGRLRPSRRSDRPQRARTGKCHQEMAQLRGSTHLVQPLGRMQPHPAEVAYFRHPVAAHRLAKFRSKSGSPKSKVRAGLRSHANKRTAPAKTARPSAAVPIWCTSTDAQFSPMPRRSSVRRIRRPYSASSPPPPRCRDRSGAQRTVARHVRKFGVVALRRPRICVSETPNS